MKQKSLNENPNSTSHAEPLRRLQSRRPPSPLTTHKCRSASESIANFKSKNLRTKDERRQTVSESALAFLSPSFFFKDLCFVFLQSSLTKRFRRECRSAPYRLILTDWRFSVLNWSSWRGHRNIGTTWDHAIIRVQFWYKCCPYELVNPAIKISVLMTLQA